MTGTPSWARTQPPELDVPELEYVGFWARVGAALIDTLMILIVTVPLTYMIYGRYTAPPGTTYMGAMDAFINLVLPAIVVVWLWAQLQATPGKLAMSARIVDADTGNKPKVSQLVIRYLGYFVSMIPLFIGIFWVAFDRRKQGWHDKMANTVVVRPAGKEAVKFKAGRSDPGERREPSA
jgi:uncharacterized RDD family membrane protein YckC